MGLELVAAQMSPGNPTFRVHLDRWIIEDGNYGDFRVGEVRKFALEFWTPALLKTSKKTTSCRQGPDYSYSASGKLVFATPGVSVIDCGVLAYSERKGVVPEGCAAGDFVRGELSFGVDPFFYFESLYKISGVPALIYEWRIDSMEQDTTPYILSEVCGRPGYVRDESKRSFSEVRGTDQNVAKPPDTCPSFVLHCTMLETARRHEL